MGQPSGMSRRAGDRGAEITSPTNVCAPGKMASTEARDVWGCAMDRAYREAFKAQGTYLLRRVSYIYLVYTVVLVVIVVLGLAGGAVLSALLKSEDSLVGFAGVGAGLLLVRCVYPIMAIAGLRTLGPDRANTVGMVAASITLAVCLAYLARSGFSTDLMSWAPIEWAKVILCSLYLIGLVKVRRHPVRQRIEF